MNLLILSSNNGAGHNSAGRAILEEAHGRGIPGAMVDALSLDAPWKSKAVAEIHIQGALHAPRLFEVGNRLAEKAGEREGLSGCYRLNAHYAEKLWQYIREGGYDTVICTHVFPALTMTEIRRRLQPGLPAYFVATDYGCAPYVCETELDGYFIPHPSLRRRFLDEGVPFSRIVPTGIPVVRRFWERCPKAEARRRLGLPEEGQVVLVMTGSMGFGNAEGEVLSLYRALQGKARILVMGGSNEKLKTTLRREFGDTITVLDYTREVPLYMDAADVLITKPGGLSTTESAVCRIPTVLTAPIPGWEEENVAFFVSHGLARFAVEPEEIALEVCRLLEDPSAREGMMLCQRREIGTSAAENIMDYVEKREMTAHEAGEEE